MVPPPRLLQLQLQTDRRTGTDHAIKPTHLCLGPAEAGIVSCRPAAPAVAGAAAVGAFLGFGFARKLGSTNMASAASRAAALLRASRMADKLMNSGGLRPPSAPDAPLPPAHVRQHKQAAASLSNYAGVLMLQLERT